MEYKKIILPFVVAFTATSLHAMSPATEHDNSDQEYTSFLLAAKNDQQEHYAQSLIEAINKKDSCSAQSFMEKIKTTHPYPLIKAISNGHLEMVKTLANYYKPEDIAVIALFKATKNKQRNIALFIFKNFKSFFDDLDNEFKMTKFGSKYCVQYESDYGVYTRRSHSSWDKADAKIQDFYRENSILYKAVTSGSPDTVEFLIKEFNAKILSSKKILLAAAKTPAMVEVLNRHIQEKEQRCEAAYQKELAKYDTLTYKIGESYSSLKNSCGDCFSSIKDCCDIQ